MQLFNAIFQLCKNGCEDFIYWMKTGSVHPRTRSFFHFHFGRFCICIWYVLGRVSPDFLYSSLLVRALKNTGLFDQDHYLQTNADVAESGLDPLTHYIGYGDYEGRAPNPLFDPNFYRSKSGISKYGFNSLLHYCLVGRYQGFSPSPWFDIQYYIRHNRDVERQGIEPLFHYLHWGGVEGRSPNPSFDGTLYLKSFPDVKVAGINPLLHYIAHGRHEGRATRQITTDTEDDYYTGQPVQLPEGNLWKPGAWVELESRVNHQGSQEPRVAVVIPVYRDRRLTWRCLASVLSAPCQTSFRLLVIDDAGPEAELSADLDEMARRGWIELLRNECNRGFVSSVNRGMQATEGLDVILLNSDTEVYPGWLDRLQQAAWRSPRIASVTPLSNNATIASYPRFLHDNPYPLEIDYPTLDGLAAQVNAGSYIEVPTGVGFCMYMRRDAIDLIGLFDEEAFGKGYGEENDWCQRAILRGLCNVIATDVFVRHFGSASFQGEKSLRVTHALKVMQAKHPSYNQQVQSFIKSDLLYKSRERLDWARLENQKQKENVLIVCHNRGGGAERHVQEDTQSLLDAGKGVFYLRPVRGKSTHVRFAHPGCRQLFNNPIYALKDTSGLVDAMQKLQITAIHLHGLVDMVPEAADYLLAVAQALRIPLDVDIHDYKAICPRINLADQRGFYCGEPDEQACDNCLTKNGNDFGVTSIGPWRDMHYRVLSAARNISVPDEDVAQRLARYFSGLNIQVNPHEDIDTIKPESLRINKSDKPLHVVVIGAIGIIKGYEMLLGCAKEARKKRLPIRFSVLGYSMDDSALEAAGVNVTGRYHDDEALARLQDLAPDIVFLPSIWPETYSYTLSIALQAGYPTYVFDIGAPAARLRRLGYEQWILPLSSAQSVPVALDALFNRLVLKRLNECG